MKASQNQAKDVERKPPTPPDIAKLASDLKASEAKIKALSPPQRPKSYVLPDRLRQIIGQALLTSSPKQLSVSEVNQILSDLDKLREVKQNG